MDFHCETQQQEPRPVLAIRTRTDVQNLQQILGQAYMKIGQYLDSLGEQPGGAPYVAYYNMDMQDLDIEIGFPTCRALPAQGEIQSGNLPAVRIATCIYTGPYEEMPPAYEALNAWMKAEGLQPSGEVYEFYLNDPMVTAPQALQTQIVFPLK